MIELFLFRFVNCVVFYGLSFGLSLIGGNVFLNSFLFGIVEVPAIIITIPIMNTLGRRWTSTGAHLSAGLSCFVCMALFDREG